MIYFGGGGIWVGWDLKRVSSMIERIADRTRCKILPMQGLTDLTVLS
jgi:hypothetical protein